MAVRFFPVFGGGKGAVVAELETRKSVDTADAIPYLAISLADTTRKFLTLNRKYFNPLLPREKRGWQMNVTDNLIGAQNRLTAGRRFPQTETLSNDRPDWKCGGFFTIFFAMDTPIDIPLDCTLVRRTLVDFIRTETRNAGFERAVVGVSGGVDSAVSVTLAAEALGKENVLGVSMPYKTSSPSSAADAAGLLGQIGVRSETVDISPMVDAFIARDPGMDRLRKGNLMARARMITLYDISARDRSIVVGTSNKTEILLGYGTLFGDTACGINPVGDLYKTQVWELASAIGVPRAIVEKKPTADLWPGQTDEEELGFGYTLADSLLFRMVDEGRGDDELASMGFRKEFIDNVRGRIRANEFKRRPPLIASVPRRAGKAGSRDPMDWGI